MATRCSCPIDQLRPAIGADGIRPANSSPRWAGWRVLPSSHQATFADGVTRGRSKLAFFMLAIASVASREEQSSAAAVTSTDRSSAT